MTDVDADYVNKLLQALFQIIQSTYLKSLLLIYNVLVLEFPQNINAFTICSPEVMHFALYLTNEVPIKPQSAIGADKGSCSQALKRKAKANCVNTTSTLTDQRLWEAGPSVEP